MRNFLLFKRLMKWSLIGVWLQFLLFGILIAQDRTISGQITSEEDGGPIPGVNVLIKGTTTGTITDIDGNYNLVVPEDAVLIYTYVGFATQEIVVGNQSEIVVIFQPDVTQLEEIVVTALGIERTARSIGYSTQRIDEEELGDVPVNDVMASLQGKVAGVNILTASGVMGATKITIRGESSLRNNTPLYVVDGTPINGGYLGSGDDAWNYGDAPIDFGGLTQDINAQDIESITILKGASAAALYGSRASNGVILITTKTGKNAKGVGVSFNTSSTWNDILKIPDYNTKWGTGYANDPYYAFFDEAPEYGGRPRSQVFYVFRGQELGQGQEYVQYGSPLDANGNQIPIPWELRGTPEDFYETGRTFSNNLSISGANELGNFRLSYTNLDKTGIVPNTEVIRNTVALSASLKATEKLHIQTHVNYVHGKSDNVEANGYNPNSVTYQFLWWPSDVDMDWFRDYWVEGQEDVKQAHLWNWTDNPYLIAFEHLNGFNKNRLFGNISATYDFTDNLSLMVRSGVDQFSENRTFQMPFSSLYARQGMYREQSMAFTERNTDFLLTYNASLGADFKLPISFGGNRLTQKFSSLTVEAASLVVPGVYNLGNAAGVPSINDFDSEKEIQSLYGLATLAFRDKIFLAVTGRNDWSSTLGTDNYSFFYPSVALSAVMTDMFELPQVISFNKLFINWGQTGNDTSPFLTSSNLAYGTLPGAARLERTLQNADLKNELSSTFEIGTDLRFLKNRLNFDFTYYVTQTTNQIIPLSTSTTSGVDARWINGGKIQNSGIELLINTVPLELSNGFRWELDLNYSTYKTEVIDLPEGVDNLVIASGIWNGAYFNLIAREGGPLGEFYGRGFLRVEGGQFDGQIIHDDNGNVVNNPTLMSLGDYNPDWMGAIINNFYYKGFNLGFQFDTRQGGQIYSYTNPVGSGAGTLSTLQNYYEDDYVHPGVIQNADGSFRPNDVSIAPDNAHGFLYGRVWGVAENWIYDNNYTKLRELHFGYTFPNSLTSRWGIQRLFISLIGRNLVLWTDIPNIDPEGLTTNGNNQSFQQGISPGVEIAQLPSTKSYGFNLKFEF